ncbi:MAG: DcaP family trimeric outer membrane transporter [Bacteroidota bacterium]
MRKKRVLLFISGLLSLANLQSQSFSDSTDIKFSGYVKADYVYDSRAIVDSRENLLLFYPKDNSDPSHDNPTYNQYALISRVRADISGAEIWNAESSAAIEADFSGVSNADIDGLRLRHAYLKLDWENTSALFGQYWHPLTVPEAFPKVLSLNIGAPFHAFNRGPQIRIEHQTGKFKLIGSIISQRDFANLGPLGYTPTYMYKGGHPDFHGQLHYSHKNWTLGLGGGYKALAPGLETDDTDDKISSFSAVGFIRHETKKSRLVVQSVYGENLYDQLMMGGYTIFKDNTDDGIALQNEPTATIWADYSRSFGENWKAGLFGGYAKNYTGKEYTDADCYARGKDIAYVYRIAPRVLKNINNLMAGFESEYTVAMYQNADQQRDVAGNLRLSLILIYRF